MQEKSHPISKQQDNLPSVLNQKENLSPVSQQQEISFSTLQQQNPLYQVSQLQHKNSSVVSQYHQDNSFPLSQPEQENERSNLPRMIRISISSKTPINESPSQTPLQLNSPNSIQSQISRFRVSKRALSPSFLLKRKV
jgi:hypothetical protein